MSTYDNVFEKGVLVRYHTRAWEGRKKVHDNPYFEDGVNADMVNITKALIPRETIKEIIRIQNKGRTEILKASLPFPVEGLYYVPLGKVKELDNTLTRLKAEFEDAVEIFLDNYETFVEEAKEKLGILFKEDDYPSVDYLRHRFSIHWMYIEIAPPSGRVNQYISVAREQEKFVEQMNEFQRTTVNYLRQQVSEMVSHLADRLRDGKIFRNSSVNKIKEFIDDFKEFNVFGDKQLEEQIEKLNLLLDGVDPDDLRNYEGERTRIAKALSEVEEQIENMLVGSRHYRKIRRKENVA